jgi:hypothetical protein
MTITAALGGYPGQPDRLTVEFRGSRSSQGRTWWWFTTTTRTGWPVQIRMWRDRDSNQGGSRRGQPHLVTGAQARFVTPRGPVTIPVASVVMKRIEGGDHWQQPVEDILAAWITRGPLAPFLDGRFDPAAWYQLQGMDLSLARRIRHDGTTVNDPTAPGAVVVFQIPEVSRWWMLSGVDLTKFNPSGAQHAVRDGVKPDGWTDRMWEVAQVGMVQAVWAARANQAVTHLNSMLAGKPTSHWTRLVRVELPHQNRPWEKEASTLRDLLAAAHWVGDPWEKVRLTLGGEVPNWTVAVAERVLGQVTSADALALMCRGVQRAETLVYLVDHPAADLQVWEAALEQVEGMRRRGKDRWVNKAYPAIVETIQNAVHYDLPVAHLDAGGLAWSTSRTGLWCRPATWMPYPRVRAEVLRWHDNDHRRAKLASGGPSMLHGIRDRFIDSLGFPNPLDEPDPVVRAVWARSGLCTAEETAVLAADSDEQVSLAARELALAQLAV